MDSRWTIAVLGGLEARFGSRTISVFPTKRSTALLARLAFLAGEPLQRDEAMEMLWPEVDPERGRNRLSVELSRLRDVFRSVAPGSVIGGDPQTLFLDRDMATTDLAEFEARRQKSLHASDGETLIPLLSSACDLYRGPLLPEAEEAWVLPAREKVARQYLQITARLVSELLKSGDTAAALERARAAVARERFRRAPGESLREDADLLLMLLLIKAGRHREALDQFEELHRLLEEEDRQPSRDALRLAQDARQHVSGEIRTAVSMQAPAASGILLLMEVDRGYARHENRLHAAIAEQTEEFLRETIRRFGGSDYRTVDHCLYTGFKKASDAFACAIECDKSLKSASWPADAPVPRLRAAIHYAEWEGEDYFPVGVQAASTFLAPAHPGQILVSAAARGQAVEQRGAAWELAPLGLFRLGEGDTPERLYQLSARGLNPEVFPPPNAPFAYKPCLPTTFGSFVGREQDVARLQALLRADGTRLVTLTGPGGIGKTRLAIECGRAAEDRFSGAIWFVPLAELTGAEQVPFAILRARGVVPDPDAQPIAAAAAALPTSECLLILDNFEHLVDEGAATVRELLERVPELTIVVTSRRKLELSPEQEYEVRPLSAPARSRRAASATLLDTVRANAAVQLFADRARQSRTGFEITDRNAEAVAEICRRLDGIPLAIELAASWAKMLTPPDMLSRLEKILVTHKQDVPARHRSVAAAVEGSYLLLDNDLRKCFDRLSVFRGGWTLAAAAHVCEDADILDRLLRLQDRSMILADETDEGYRGRMLEPLRAYASERLEESGELAAVRSLHTKFFESFAEDVGREVEGPNQLPSLRRFESEYQNLHGALEVGSRKARLNIAAHMQWFWRLRGHRTEGLTWVQDALSDPADVPEDILFKARNTGGILAWAAGDFDTARRYLEPMLDIYRERGDERGYAVALVNLANLASHSGDFAQARLDYERSLAVWRSLDETKPLAITLSNLGAAAVNQADLPAARAYLEEALALAGAEDIYLRAQILHNLAETAYEERDFGAAKGRMRESLDLRTKIGERDAMWNIAFLLARIAIKTGHDHDAACLFGLCEAIEEMGQVVVSPSGRQDVRELVEPLKARMQESEFRRNFGVGRAMQWEQMLEYVRVGIERPT